MGVIVKKWGLWVLLAFSLALNIGFLVAVTGYPDGLKRKGPNGRAPFRLVMRTLDEMDVSDIERQDVAAAMKRMVARHIEIREQVMVEEDKMLALIGRPTPLAASELEAQALKISELIKGSILDKPRHIIEIRNMIGPERTSELISRIRKKIKKRLLRRKKIKL